MNPKVTVIVLCYNNQQLLTECLESIQSQTYKNLEVIMVDNGSSDNSVEFVRQNFPKVKVLETGKNLGFAGGNNKGIELAFKDRKVKYVALLNTDARLEAEWLANLVSFAITKPNGAGFQGLTLNYFDKTRVDSYGIVVNQLGEYVQMGYMHQRQKNYKPKEVFGVNAAACLYARAFLEAQPFADYLDEKMFMYYEDIDLAVRAQVMGWQNYFVPNAVAYHMASASKKRYFSARMMSRNRPLVLVKNFPAGILKKMLKRYIKTEFKILGRFIKEKDFVSFVAAIIGKFQAIFYLPAFFIKRRVLRQKLHFDWTRIWSLM